jgi:hypothetical protein
VEPVVYRWLRQAHPGPALRPSRHRRRGRRRRLVRPTHQHPHRPGQRRRHPVQGPTRRRTPLQRLQRPLAVAPLFLHRNDRIAALITVICLALLIFCLIEREARNNLAPETEIVGFYAYDNRAVKPTGRLILAALAHLQLVPAHDGQAAQVIRPGYLQARLLDLLRVDPTRPRWLTK